MLIKLSVSFILLFNTVVYYNSNAKTAPFNFEQTDPELLITQGNESLDGNNVKLAAKCYDWAGYHFSNNEKPVRAIDAYFKAAICYEKIGNDTLLSNVNLKIGIVFYRLYNYQIANKYYQKALTSYKKLTLHNKANEAIFNIAQTYLYLEKYDSATYYYLTALNGFKMENSIHKQAAVYNELGLLQKQLKEYEHSRKYYLKLLDLAKSVKDTIRIARAYNNIGNTYLESGNLEKSEYYFQKALTFKQMLPDRKFLLSTLNNLATLSLEKSDTSKAIAYLKEAEQLSTGNKYDLHFTLATLRDIYITRNDSKNAMAYSESTETLFTEIINSNRLADSENRYYQGQLALQQLREFEKRQIHNQRHYIAYVLASTALVLFVFLGVLQYRKLQQRRAVLMKIRDLATI